MIQDKVISSLLSFLWSLSNFDMDAHLDSTWSLLLLHPSSQFIHRKCCNVILNGGLTPSFILLHWPQTRRLQGLLCWGTFPNLLPDTPSRLTCDPPSNSMVKPFQHLHNCISKDPTLTPVQHHCLHYHLIHHFPGSHPRPCLHHNGYICARFHVDLLYILLKIKFIKNYLVYF